MAMLKLSPRPNAEHEAWERGYTEPQTADPYCPKPTLRKKDKLRSGGPALSMHGLRRYVKAAFEEIETKRDQLRVDAAGLAATILCDVVGLTTEIFGEDVHTYQSFDPEFPQDKWTVFEVVTNVPPEQILQMEDRWVSGVSRIAPEQNSIRLLISPSQ